MEKPAGSSVNSLPSVLTKKMKLSVEVGDPVRVSRGLFMRPVDAPSYSRKLKPVKAITTELESSDPELEKLWRDIDDFCDSDKAHNVSTATRNLFPVDSCKNLARSEKDMNGGSKIHESDNISTSMGKRKRSDGLDFQEKERSVGDTGFGYQRRKEILDGTKTHSSSASSVSSSHTKSAKGLPLSFWDKFKHRNCRKTPLSELKIRRKGEMQGSSNTRTFESGLIYQMKNPTLQKGGSRLHKENRSFQWRQSSFSADINKGNYSIGNRERVKKALNLFRVICKELLHEGQFQRIDYKAARIIKGRPDFVDLGKFVGSVPGVDIGDEYRYRMEVALVSLHKPPEAGIDFMRYGTNDICISIVATGCGDYSNDMHNPEFLTYCGQEGNVGRGRKEPEDQKLEKGNLALKNSITARNPVRVIRGKKEIGKIASVYIYDGLYTVETFWQEKAAHGKLVFKFKLRRILGQPELSRDQWMKLGAY